MRYVSTRGDAPVLSFGDVLLAGLASDGGLYLPETFPRLSTADLDALAGRPYHETAARVLAPFVAPSLSFDDLAELTDAAYGTFRHRDVVPLSRLSGGEYLAELYWGPTLSFKDIALQLLGRLFEFELRRRSTTMTVVGATSGDTGSAAVEACRDRVGVQLVMLHPADRITELQRRQMTTVSSPNVHNAAVDGTFDDCQDLVKGLFADRALRERLRLGAVNSINWARIAAQTVYYVTCALQMGAPRRPVQFCVPTGNFGNVLAADVARRMGVPISGLTVAANHNDILARAHRTGRLTLEPVVPSTSPAMDIAVSSNFERLVFQLGGRDGRTTAERMAQFRACGTVELGPAVHEGYRTGFDAAAADETEVASAMAQVLQQDDRFICPHTAVAVHAWRRSGPSGAPCSPARPPGRRSDPVAVMATAHPAKFTVAVEAATGRRVDLPPQLSGLADLPERCARLPNDAEAVRAFVLERCG